MDMRFAEEMSGTYRGLVDGFPGGAFRFAVAVHCADLQDPRIVQGDIAGKVYLEGVVEGAPLEGTIEISPLYKKTLTYRFTFPLEGRTYRFDGTKHVKFLRPLKTMTTLPGTIYDENDKPVAEGTVRFRMRDLVSFMASYRFGRTAKGSSAVET